MERRAGTEHRWNFKLELKAYFVLSVDISEPENIEFQ